MTNTGDEPEAADGYPQLGSTHKNGDRRFGIRGLTARVLAARGTPMLSSLHHSTVTEHVRLVRVGDQLRVQWDGAHWWSSSTKGHVGRLSWPKSLRDGTTYASEGRSPYDFNDGTLNVREVTVDASGTVIDCGGYVIPDGFDPSEWPMASMPDPMERELAVTIHVPVPAVQAEPTPSRRRTLLDRLLGR